jgi:methionyl-tRNA formyltransferase
MTKEELRIVYMGTPDFAVAPLKKILEEGYNVVGVITVADKPAGRGRNLRESPVKVFALEKGIKVLQPTNLKDPEFLKELSDLGATIQIIVAFRMLPEVVWQMPPLGSFNLHASLLPQYRGAAPINWAIINGEEYTGVTTFFLQHEIDTGKILLQEKVKIEDEDNAGTLHDKLMHTGSKLVASTLDKLLSEELVPIDQSQLKTKEHPLKEAPKLFKEDCLIDFDQDTRKLYDLIRGLSPYPAAYCEMKLANGTMKTAKIFSVRERKEKGIPGTFKSENGELLVFTSNGALEIRELQLEGKKRMTAAEFLRGTKLAE